MADIYRKENGKVIFGRSLPIFIKNGPYYLAELKIYQDGVIDCWDKVDLQGLEEKLAGGWVTTMIPDNTDLNMQPLGRIKVESFAGGVKPSELIKEVRDILEELNARPTSLQKCQKAWLLYDANPTAESQTLLKKAYEEVPEHHRPFLGGPDVKDIPIRMVIYGDHEIENWPHRIAAKKLGQSPLPTITVKRPKG